MKHKYFECNCHSPEHRLVFYWDNDSFEPEDFPPELYASILLNKHNFWRRLLEGIKYIFGYQSKYGMFDDFVLRYEDISKFKKILNEYETGYKKFLNKHCSKVSNK